MGEGGMRPNHGWAKMSWMEGRAVGSCRRSDAINERASDISTNRRVLTMTQPFGLFILSFEYEILHDPLVVVIERQTTTQEDVEDDSQRPDIRLDAEIPLSR
jgi:hypothetical protein